MYNENESTLLHRTITKFKDKFDSLNDSIKCFDFVCANKMLGDNNPNQSINFSKIQKLYNRCSDTKTLKQQSQPITLLIKVILTKQPMFSMNNTK